MAAPATAATDAPLRIIAVDVEGGAATLYITPQGHSILIDTGWPAGIGGPRPAKQGEAPAYVLNSAERIVAAAKAEGLSKIDYLVVSHYHVDHVGGVADLLKLFPVGTVIDHGPNRENPAPGTPEPMLRFATATLYPAYIKAIEGLPHRVMVPGEILQVDDLMLTVVDSSSALIPVSLPGGGQPGVGCDKATAMAEDGGDENARSLGFLMRWGKSRIFAGGDTSWNIENALVCPTNRIGTVDLYIANNHGSGISNGPAFVNSIAPRVVIFDNGPTKGADASVFDTVRASPRLQALWQVHSAERSPEKDAPAAHVVNLKGGTDGFALKAQVARSGAITLVNPRTGDSETYSAK
jgi:beta-lactamase superfamily II metal-dependent hydrolase